MTIGEKFRFRPDSPQSGIENKTVSCDDHLEMDWHVQGTDPGIRSSGHDVLGPRPPESGINLSEGILLPLNCWAITGQAGTHNGTFHTRRQGILDLRKLARDPAIPLENRIDIE